MDYEKIKSDKAQETIELYEKIEIDLYNNKFFDFDNCEEIPDVQENTDQKEDIIFHWTRLSSTSSIGCVSKA